jgi:mannosidase alpha-like ER degradation enhancer 2
LFVTVASINTVVELGVYKKDNSMKTVRAVLAGLLLLTSLAGCGGSADRESAETIAFQKEKARYAELAREEYLHAWNGYKTYAWGHDDLKPLSKSFHDWYAEPLLMSAVDALDGLVMLGFKDEAGMVRDYLAENLSFDKDIPVKNFEIVIRLLGGLLASYQLTGDHRLLELANDLGTRLLPVFDSPTGMPYTFVNLRTGETSGPYTNPAEIGTLTLEFGTLAMLTGKPEFYEKPKKAAIEIYERRSSLGLVGAAIDVETGEWKETTSHLSGRIDSYYEYLLKASLLFDDPDFGRMFRDHLASINNHLLVEAESGLWYGWIDMNTGKPVASYYGALDAFFPAVLALAGDLGRAARLQASCYAMWNLHGIEPELIDFETMKVVEKAEAYHLRPEIIESAYYLYHYTGDSKYVEMGMRIFDALREHCRTEAGYAALGNVITKEKIDSMESFLFGETLKYLYLLFAEEGTKYLDEIVFTTEAHPLRRTW